MQIKKRLPYIIAFTVLLTVEFLIGAFVNDSFIRPYVGDMLVTVLLCALLRVIFLKKLPFIPLWVFFIGIAAEIIQLLKLPQKLGITSPILKTALGSTFDIADIVCYGLGCVVFFAAELLIRKILSIPCCQKRK